MQSRERKILRGHDKWVKSPAFSPNGKRFVTPQGTTPRGWWDAETSKQIAVMHGHDDKIWSAAFSRTQTPVFLVGDAGGVASLDRSENRLTCAFKTFCEWRKVGHSLMTALRAAIINGGNAQHDSYFMRRFGRGRVF
jgi:WD40 repeat protein